MEHGYLSELKGGFQNLDQPSPYSTDGLGWRFVGAVDEGGL